MSEPRRPRRVLAAALAAPVVLAAGLALAITLSGDPNQPGQGSTGDPRVGMTLYEASERVELPALEGHDLEGAKLRSTDYNGSVIVLNVWGSWCGPCRAEAPELVAVANDYPEVQFLGIDTRDNPAAAQAFVRRFNIPYPSWDDETGLILANLSGLVPISAVPSTLVVDASGQITARVIGQVDGSTLRGLLDDIINDTGAGG
jgi:thiol-disulfide isomerase/thioredoxin